MIGKNILKIRKEKGLTLSELAERSSISKSYLSNIERNIHRNPSIEVMTKIANGLDTDLKALLIGTTNEDQPKIDKEWLEFITELKESGIDIKQIKEYRTLIDFIKWQNKHY